MAASLPVVALNDESFNFSFSGLKSAVINFVHNKEQRNEEISKEDLLKKLSETSEKSLEKSITKLERQLSKTQEIDLNSFFNTKNDFNKLNKTQKAELKNAIGDELFSVLNKRKPNNIKDFILKRTEELNRKKFGLILCDTSTDSKITKSFSNIFINKKMIECI